MLRGTVSVGQGWPSSCPTLRYTRARTPYPNLPVPTIRLPKSAGGSNGCQVGVGREAWQGQGHQVVEELEPKLHPRKSGRRQEVGV